MHTDFARDLGGLLGVQPSKWEDIRSALLRALQTLPPVFFENEDKGFGLCVVCGKKGVLGRCTRCGLLMHFTCVPPELPGQEQKCPVCHRVKEDDGLSLIHI